LFLSSEKSYSDTYKSYDPKPDVEELEMLLEAYFAQINGILQKLSTVRIPFKLFYLFETKMNGSFVFVY